MRSVSVGHVGITGMSLFGLVKDFRVWRNPACGVRRHYGGRPGKQLIRVFRPLRMVLAYLRWYCTA